MEIGKMISILRTEKGLSQRDLASRLSVSNGTIGMWETGKREPDLSTVIKIANFFDVSVDYLLGIVAFREISHRKEENNTIEESLLLQSFNRCDDECKKYLLAKAHVLSVEGISAVTVSE